MLIDGLARVVSEERLTLITGGTDAGVFSLLGAGLGDHSPAASVGVAPAGRVTWPGRTDAAPDAVPLEPHHSHFALVEGEEWGAAASARQHRGRRRARVNELSQQALVLHHEARVKDQLGYYGRVSDEYERASAQSVAVAAVLLALTTLAGTLAGLEIEGKVEWAIVAAVLPAPSTALAAYEALLGFERIGKLYADAFHSIQRLDVPDLTKAPGDASAAQRVAAYADAVETVLRNEQSQWGQLTAKIELQPGGEEK
jgi:SLOG in TRPM, prokaryote/SMODS and SLOG-associating 2TM effector domain 1